MQQPTLRGVRLHSVNDALKVFHAVALGYLPKITRRLDFEERREVQSGNVYVWEERSPASNVVGLGIERWTDGRQYTPSRVRDEFLLYVVKDTDPFPTGALPLDPAQAEAHRLIKQTYSVFLCDANPRKKWHITAYYTPATVRNLATVDDIKLLRDMVVPDGAYMPARNLKNPKPRQNEDSNQSSPTSPFPPHSPPGTRRRGSDASVDFPISPSGYPPPQYAPYRSRTRSNSRSNTVPLPFPHLDSPVSSGPVSAPAEYFQHSHPPTSYHDRSHSFPQRPVSARPPYSPTDPAHGPRWLPSLQTDALSMVPLPQLEESRATTYHRSPTDNDILRRFQPRN